MSILDRKVEMYAHYNHGGDMRAAVRKLVEVGLASLSPKRDCARSVEDMIRRKGGTITARSLQRHNARRWPTAEIARAQLKTWVAEGKGEWDSVKRRFTLFE